VGHCSSLLCLLYGDNRHRNAPNHADPGKYIEEKSWVLLHNDAFCNYCTTKQCLHLIMYQEKIRGTGYFVFVLPMLRGGRFI
jgi:hypothetical protein